MKIPLIVHHGTYGTAGKDIVRDKMYKIGDMREDHWLGQGIYFFREDVEQAAWWAKEKVTNTPKLSKEDAVVLQSILEVEESRFLNLDSRSGLSKLEKYLNDFEDKLNMHGLAMTDDTNVLRCFYMDNISKKEIDIIQRTFPVRSYYDKVVPITNMQLCLHGVQVCLRNSKLVKQDSIGIVKHFPSDTIRRKKRSRRRRININT
ncbi:hypothetical protein BTR22_19000 [Alkalihalophilus pseudofirmus]|uniref:hypothetical protein n=1 Tax=Alkalihalophilus pseudofirmus TaxID=79885 RepID=UPI0009535BFC|nr:hypothetical protein BTR22_19000 [Alkalihalophilus pseudofirmus]